ncbi:hypothetical protein [Dyadobacter psychrotolerans]|uniref:Uncharacterized protein n=1 Tax=Dyadobacter psychrotolerans TaxID=2541721 RepID=A0A4R5DVK8_9BACT|nr:hypothetical protein [Dyadobacter psychrotolerans]TDE15275.1 hypothetical protein E0F88_12185 [Dyadobacter psychrotolerans]
MSNKERFLAGHIFTYGGSQIDKYTFDKNDIPGITTGFIFRVGQGSTVVALAKRITTTTVSTHKIHFGRRIKMNLEFSKMHFKASLTDLHP